MRTKHVAVALFTLAAAGGLAARAVLTPKPADLPADAAAADPIPAPEFAGVTGWLNTEPLTAKDFKGKVTVVHFWTNGCINCVHNYPHYRAWQDRYAKNESFRMVGVHTPEFDSEKGIERIKKRMADNKLTFAVAVDNDRKTWQAWGNRYWPCVYVVDRAGNVVYRWEGEFGDDGYKKATAKIDELLAAAD